MSKYTTFTLIITEINKFKLKSGVTKSDNINKLLGRMLRNKQIVDARSQIKAHWKQLKFITTIPIMRRMREKHESSDVERK